MKNKVLTSILTGALAVSSCVPQKEISQIQPTIDPCQSEWTESPTPITSQENITGNIAGTKRSQIKGESQSWETFRIFEKDYYAQKDITAQNPLGFDLTKKDLVAIAFSPLTGKTEALPLAMYHPVQIVDAEGKPHKELTIENINLNDPKFSGCNINQNKINFKDYGIETTVIAKKTYLIVEPQGEINENERLSLYIIPLTSNLRITQDPKEGKLKIQSTGNYLEAYKLINEELMQPEQNISTTYTPKTTSSVIIPNKLEKKAEELKNLKDTSNIKQPLDYKEKVNSQNSQYKLPNNSNLPPRQNYSKVQHKK